jgi:hypothetical protein
MAWAMHARWSAAWAGVMQSRAASAMAVRIISAASQAADDVVEKD